MFICPIGKCVNYSSLQSSRTLLIWNANRHAVIIWKSRYSCKHRKREKDPFDLWI